jgi:hypothetical protein
MIEPNPKPPTKRGRKETLPALRKERVNARLPNWLNEWLETRPEGAGEAIAEALMVRHKLKPPKL